MKQWKKHELYRTFTTWKKIYFSKIQLKDKIIHRLFENTIEKFAIATFIYAYELGKQSKK